MTEESDAVETTKVPELLELTGADTPAVLVWKSHWTHNVAALRWWLVMQTFYQYLRVTILTVSTWEMSAKHWIVVFNIFSEL